MFALAAAIAWGSGDFTGGLAARRIGPLRTVLISYSIGLIALMLAALASREHLPAPADLAWGALAGLLGMVGIGFLLRGFTTGQMGIVAPVSATLAAAIPVVFALIAEGVPGQLKLVGFGLALVSIWLLARPASHGARPEGLSMALLAGLGFGGFFIALDRVGEGTVFWPLVAGRLAACGALAVFALFARRAVLGPELPAVPLALAGILDIGGNLFFLRATQSGRLDVAAMVGSLYPAVTAILAWLIVKESLAGLQRIGVALAVLAIVLITL